jgi:hypothetical protein
VEARRPDDPLPQPVYTRPAPVRRHWAIRLVVTVVSLALVYDAWRWVADNPGPPRAFAAVIAVATVAGCVATLVWAWRKHPF